MRSRPADRRQSREVPRGALSPDQAVQAGFDLLRSGDAAGAERLFREVLGVQPDHVGAMHGLGVIALTTEHYQEAIGILSRALAADRDRVEVQCDLASALAADERPQEALPLLRRALRARPDAFVPHHTHAVTLFKLGRYDEAEGAVRRALAFAPDHPTALLTRGLILEGKGWYQAAAGSYRRVAELEPGNARARVREGNALIQLGRTAEGLAIIDGLLAAGTEDRLVESAALLALLYGSRTGAQIHGAHKRVASRIESSVPRLPLAPRPREGRLRVGYLSPDFRLHSVAFFFEPVLARHDRAKVEVFCYQGNTFADEVTARLKGLAEHWVECGTLDDAALAARIRDDRIDVLVDLAGPTAGGRLRVLAQKPAPVQVAWLGYPASSGLGAIDARISDGRADPPGVDAGGERIVRLPGSYFCYAPPRDAPAISPPPCVRKGNVTFGSFNTLAKLSDDCVALWAGALARTPGARLLLKAKALNEPAAREQTAARFAAHRIGAERLALRGWSAKMTDHLAAYREVDIALDTFPYNGATTTCDALWMGVPVVSLAGERHASRMGLSILSAAGRPEWCSSNSKDFGELAAALASNAAALADLRNGMRDRLRDCALLDAAAFASALESALEGLVRS